MTRREKEEGGQGLKVGTLRWFLMQSFICSPSISLAGGREGLDPQNQRQSAAL